jgi:hypothetical protein
VNGQFPIGVSAKRGWELFNAKARCNKCLALTETQRVARLEHSKSGGALRFPPHSKRCARFGCRFAVLPLSVLQPNRSARVLQMFGQLWKRCFRSWRKLVTSSRIPSGSEKKRA